VNTQTRTTVDMQIAAIHPCTLRYYTAAAAILFYILAENARRCNCILSS